MQNKRLVQSGAALAAISAMLLAGCGSKVSDPNFAKVDTDRILSEGLGKGEWMTYGGTYDEQRFSPLEGITPANVGSLGVAWTYEFPTNLGTESTPIVVDGVIYATGSWSVVVALDARTGKVLWTYDPKVPREQLAKGCCDAVNRGVAVYDGRVFVGTFDGRLVALDAKTGKLMWSTVTVDESKPYTITGAPRVVKGKVLIGNGGAELGVRGYVSAYDAKTGKLAWRFYATPNPDKKPDGAASDDAFAKIGNATWGNSGKWKTDGGGGTPWDSIVYDSVNDSILVGFGNASPWNSKVRDPEGNGDNLFVGSIVALDPATGKYKWHFQETPRDQWDYTSTQSIVLADLPLGPNGTPRRVVMHAPKNGFFYVLDAKTGKFIQGKAYAPQNWASGLDANGRPQVVPQARTPPPEGFMQFPGPQGAHNWPPMGFNPKTGLVYIPTEKNAQFYVPSDPANLPKSKWNLGYNMAGGIPLVIPKGALPQVQAGMGGGLLAWDPIKQEARWSIDLGSAANGGILTTTTGLLFQGTKMGLLRAYDATNGKVLWETNLKRGVTAPAITYTIGGEQYVAVTTGWGSSWALNNGLYWKDKVTRVPGRLVVLKLGAKGAIPDNAASGVEASPKTKEFGTEQQVAHGLQLYAFNCMVCHGPMVQSSGVLPDLRWSMIASDPQAWRSVVIDGALKGNGMVSFASKISPEDAEAIRAYAINQGWMAVRNGDAKAPKP
ncbi:MAG: PQQ-dependent dehydrogenase, methanol/ethanol family [Proteobacteria bacterium]|nr:PQQ-dependent dehydrogenase, methanol/ethanol family [Pseudomonadota bacterium]